MLYDDMKIKYYGLSLQYAFYMKFMSTVLITAQSALIIDHQITKEKTQKSTV